MELIGIVVIPVTATVIGYIRKLEKKVDSNTECNTQNSKSIGRLEDQMNKHEANVEKMFQEHKLEAKDDKTDLKVLTNTVTLLTERVAESQKIHNDFREDIRQLEQKIIKSHDDLMSFFTDWIQRLENISRDRV